MSSDYIVNREVAIIRQTQARAKMSFLSAVADTNSENGTDTVHDKNMRPRDAKPLRAVPK